MSVQARAGRYQLRVVHKLLPRPFFHTFPTADEARAYGQQLQALLAKGIVPAELAAQAPRVDDPLLVQALRAYLRSAPVAPSDEALLGTMIEELAGVRVSQAAYAWAESYVRRLKVDRNLAPGSIRKRVGSLARVIDWHHRTVTPAGQVPPATALRLLPSGYSAYSRADIDAAAARGHGPRRDQARDRRLAPDEEARIRRALAGERRPDRERALAVDPDLTMLFELLLHAGLRLREAYKLRVGQIDLRRGVIDVEGSKGHRGQARPRQVPMTPALEDALRAHCRGRVGLLLGFWDGRAETLRATTSRLSARFASLFAFAQVPGLTEHDLRHEATCRWVEMRAPGGGWLFSDLEVCRIMGWTDPRMMLRYASLRGEDLAARMRGAGQVPGEGSVGRDGGSA
ncbi:MAG TPA: site-specific integrase [Rubrivivax sp.]|nr:site-specific integrase [Rubrivivax sp.]HMR68868.1 site-specific integrase [Rubrivivax sp.]